jgi:predicted DNA-binding transcriptional regulator AlpA
MLEGYVTMNELAELAKLSVGTAYQYRHKGQYEFPEPNLRLGQILLWKRSTAIAWARNHRKRTGR